MFQVERYFVEKYKNKHEINNVFSYFYNFVLS